MPPETAWGEATAAEKKTLPTMQRVKKNLPTMQRGTTTPCRRRVSSAAEGTATAQEPKTQDLQGSPSASTPRVFLKSEATQATSALQLCLAQALLGPPPTPATAVRLPTLPAPIPLEIQPVHPSLWPAQAQRERLHPL